MGLERFKVGNRVGVRVRVATLKSNPYPNSHYTTLALTPTLILTDVNLVLCLSIPLRTLVLH